MVKSQTTLIPSTTLSGGVSELLLDDVHSRTGPLHERLARALREAIRAGRLPAGSPLPASRRLAAELGCSRWAVTEAYGQLTAEGYLAARGGSATRVRWSRDEAARPGRRPVEPSPAPRYDLAPGLPDLRAFPRRRWADAIRAQATGLPVDDLGYPEAGGHPGLRRTLAEYLERSRGAVVAPQDVTVCVSVTDAVARLCRVLRSQRITSIAVEDPGWTRLREVIAAAGLTPVPVPLDDDGLCVDALTARRDVRALLASPAHQFPRGMVLAPHRRAALVRWARAVDGIILEDDYDAEFRYDRKPVGTLQGMDPSRVVLLKSLSKMLSPALGIGWMVTPGRLTDALRPAGEPVVMPPTIDQLAFATVLSTGFYDRHLRACRARYWARRDILVAALAEALPELPVAGIAAGLHLVLDLPAGIDPGAVVRRAAAAGVRVADLAAYHTGQTTVGHGLVLGYGNLTDTAVPEAVARLATAIVG